MLDFRRINGLLGDPGIYAFFQKTGVAVLFDVGDLSNMSGRDLLKVRIVCVSHTHIDHFIGFDRLLRVNIPHGRLLTVCGPPGITANVCGKLQAYTWNLLDPGQIRLRVHEIDTQGGVSSYSLESDDGFKPTPWTPSPPRLGPLVPPLPPAPFATIHAFEDGTRFDAVVLDHRTPSVAYACQLPARFHVREDVLQAEGLSPGPWIRDMQIALAEGDVEKMVAVNGRSYKAGDLGARLFIKRAPRPIGYLTDIGFTSRNLERASQLFAGTELLLCESNYRETERAKARDRMHLTTRQAALIAAKAGVKALEVFHISSIYSDDPEVVVQEAQAHFAHFRALEAVDLDREIEHELKLVEKASDNQP